MNAAGGEDGKGPTAMASTERAATAVAGGASCNTAVADGASHSAGVPGMAGKLKRAGGRSLSTRLFIVLFAFAFFSFVVATSIAAYVSWTVYEGEAEERLTAQLNAVSEQIAGKGTAEMVGDLAGIAIADTRITLVAQDGAVLYDSLVDVAGLGNHAQREEIKAAREQGESIVLRKSETMGTDLLYAATLADSAGTVLRLAELRASLAFYLGAILVPLFLAVLVAALLSVVLARAITRRVTAPLLNVDFDSPLESDAYREIRPLLERIDAQKTELVAQNDQLEKAMQMRREFTGNVSHEMKSPLQVIGGYAELIEGGIAGPEDVKRFAGLIRTESQSMRELIDDVLMLSRLDEDVYGEAHAVDVSKVALRVAERLRSAAQAQGVQVTLDVQPLAVLGVEQLVEQAVYNLVDNAIRYGGGLVTVAALRDGEAVCVSVSDNGPGVPTDQRERIFERFFRIDPSRSRSTGGTGLGLAIVKHAAESMGGGVSVGDSEYGGARFTLRLPAA